MATMGYGRRLFAALPPMTRIDDEGEALEWLAGLAGGRVSAAVQAAAAHQSCHQRDFFGAEAGG